MKTVGKITLRWHGSSSCKTQILLSCLALHLRQNKRKEKQQWKENSLVFGKQGWNPALGEPCFLCLLLTNTFSLPVWDLHGPANLSNVRSLGALLSLLPEDFRGVLTYNFVHVKKATLDGIRYKCSLPERHPQLNDSTSWRVHDITWKLNEKSNLLFHMPLSRCCY